MAISHFPANPDYGDGIYRRRVRLTNEPRTVTAVLNDDYHSLWCRLGHDGQSVRSVTAAVERGPYTTCPGAATALCDILGEALAISRSAFFRPGRAGSNCTHLLDIALIAMSHAARGGHETIIDIAIADADAAGRTEIEAFVDGERVHRWAVLNEVIENPSSLAGQSLFSGFVRRMEAEFEGVVLDAARMIQKGVFVARGRRFIVDQSPHHKPRDEPEREGVCYSYSSAQMAVASGNVGYARDFTDGVIETLPDF